MDIIAELDHPRQVCLWGVQQESGCSKTQVLKEIIVTVFAKSSTNQTEPREHVRHHLRGLGNDGHIYEKSWKQLPGINMPVPIQWVAHHGKDPNWVPLEAVGVYNTLSNSPEFTIVDASGNSIKPKGDVAYCEKHDRYWHLDDMCAGCVVEGQKADVLAIRI